MKETDELRNRHVPIEIDPDEFRDLGNALVERIARHLETIRDRPVTQGHDPGRIRELLESDRRLPEEGVPTGPLLDEAAALLFDNSLFNGHPRFWGYITSSPASIGILADFLASAVNANVGAWKLAPLATEIEAQTIRWIAEFVGYPSDCGGLLTSGGNVANFVGLLAARRWKAGPEVRREGLGNGKGRFRIYASSETHTWIQKAADVFGHGTEAIRWIPSRQDGTMDVSALTHRITADVAENDLPFLVVGTAGTVGTGAVDPLREIGAVCREFGLWFHVDGAYGALAASVPGAPEDLGCLSDADSVAVDPHKWLYAPLEAGCILVRRSDDLGSAFSYQPPYYHFDQETTNYFDLGLQNSRGFRALKVWLGLRQAGAAGYRRMIADDIRLATRLHDLLEAHPEFETLSRHLSITTFRYRPPRGRQRAGVPEPTESYLDELNREVLSRLESGGDAFLSNAIVNGKFALRACIVNFRTSLNDLEFLVELLTRLGRECDGELRG